VSMKPKQEVYSTITFIDFLYDKFYENYLLKMGTDAEKIVIYLTPFVLKANLKIIIYEFDNNFTIQSRDFPCYLPNKPNITLLFRKTHYDYVYSDKFFEKYTRELCFYVNVAENLKVVKNSDLDYFRQNRQSGEKITQLLLKQQQGNLSNNSPVSDNINESSGFQKCLSCGIEYLHKPNLFGFCINCLNSELSNQVLSFYLYFLSESKHMLQEGHDEINVANLFNECKFISDFSVL
jgi:hypothetical protein